MPQCMEARATIFLLYATRAQIVVRLVLEPKWQQTRVSPRKDFKCSGPDPDVFTVFDLGTEWYYWALERVTKS